MSTEQSNSLMQLHDIQIAKPQIVRPSLKARVEAQPTVGSLHLSVHMDEKTQKYAFLSLEESRRIHNRIYDLMKGFVRDKEMPFPEKSDKILSTQIDNRIRSEKMLHYTQSNSLKVLIGHAIWDFNDSLDFEHLGNDIMKFHFPSSVPRGDYNWVPMIRRKRWDKTMVPMGFITTYMGRFVFEEDWLDKIDRISRQARLDPMELWHYAHITEVWCHDPLDIDADWSITMWFKKRYSQEVGNRMATYHRATPSQLRRKLMRRIERSMQEADKLLGE